MAIQSGQLAERTDLVRIFPQRTLFQVMYINTYISIYLIEKKNIAQAGNQQGHKAKLTLLQMQPKLENLITGLRIQIKF